MLEDTGGSILISLDIFLEINFIGSHGNADTGNYTCILNVKIYLDQVTSL